MLLLLALLIGLLADRVVKPRLPAEIRIPWLLRSGKAEEAERVAWEALQRGPIDADRLLEFLDRHQPTTFELPEMDAPPGDPTRPSQHVGPTVREADIDVLLARNDLPRGVALVGNFWREEMMGGADPVLWKEMRDAADADPPLPWANRLLGRVAQGDLHFAEAARRFEREGVWIEAHASDVDLGLAIEREAFGKEAVAARLTDPRIAARASAYVRMHSALDRRDWLTAIRNAPGATFHVPPWWVLPLAISAAVAWFGFAARVGQTGRHPWRRAPLYLAAFVLGVVSVCPTLFFVAAQEAVLHLTPKGNPLQDLVFYVLGVGFREELSKLLLFAPLIPFIARGEASREEKRLDALVCGALVGLGFAAEENLLYLQQGDLSTTFARYLTANFFHMAMTGLAAEALYGFAQKPASQSLDFTRMFFFVVLMHGAYDFFLSSPGNVSYGAMLAFFFIARRFLVEISAARRTFDRGMRPGTAFAYGTTLVASATFVYACALVGPLSAVSSMLKGLLGVGIILVVFARDMQRL